MLFRKTSYLLIVAGLVATLGCESPGGTEPLPPDDGLIPNALRTYVQENYEGNGGSHYPHLKLYANLFRAELSDADKVWVASHYDMVDHGSWDFPERARQVNPQILTLTHFNVAYNNREEVPSRLEAWVESPANVRGHTLSDMLVNYSSTTQNGCGSFGSGDFLPQGKRCHWTTHDAATDAWRDWARGALIESLQLDTPHWRDGVMFDDVTFANDGMDWDQTDEYWGLDPDLEDHPRVAELYATVGYLADATDAQLPGERIYVANIGSTWWLTSPAHESRMALARRYAPNIQDETWLIAHSPSQSAKNWDSHYQGSVVRPIVEFMRQGHGYIFETGDYSNTDRGKRFTLTMFYLVNHPLAFYWYRHMNNQSAPVEDYMWNRYVEADIGQPVVNSMGQPDFEGEISTEHFVMEEGETFHLLAREYQHALIVVKLKHRDEPVGLNPSTHQLPGTFRVLQPDLTLGDPVTEITLLNNEGHILMKQ